jgi:hypothetical protein
LQSGQSQDLQVFGLIRPVDSDLIHPPPQGRRGAFASRTEQETRGGASEDTPPAYETGTIERL